MKKDRLNRVAQKQNPNLTMKYSGLPVIQSTHQPASRMTFFAENVNHLATNSTTNITITTTTTIYQRYHNQRLQNLQQIHRYY